FWRNDPAVGQDHGLAPRPPSRGIRRQKVRPRSADAGGRRSGRLLKPALASTPRNAKRGDKRAHSSNPGKAQFGLRIQFEPLISNTISGACGGNMTNRAQRHRGREKSAAGSLIHRGFLNRDLFVVGPLISLSWPRTVPIRTNRGVIYPTCWAE